MIWSYLKYAFRNLVKQKGRTLINILELSFGIACVIIIYLYRQDKFSYNAFHENRDRIYRVLTARNEAGDRVLSPFLPEEIASAIAEKIPGVEKTCGLMSSPAWVGIGEVLFNETLGFTDTNFLEIFTFPVIAGDRTNPLAQPQSIVLTETVAGKFFGDSIDDWNEIIGKSIELSQPPLNLFTITAVIQDPPENNSFKWTVLVPYHNQSYYGGCNDSYGNTSIYILLDENNDRYNTEQALQSLIEEIHGERIERNIHFGGVTREEYDFGYRLQALSDLYLNKEYMGHCYEIIGSIRSINILSGITLLILLIACFNYMMLSTGASMNRLRDFGLMDVAGARRRQIMFHLSTESFLITLVSIFTGIILAEQLLPLFNQLARDDLRFTLYDDPKNYLFLLSVLGGIVFATSSYTGYYILRNRQPIRFLRKEIISTKKNGVARLFVMLQYFITVVLLISSLVIMKQLHYMVNKDVGFETDDLLVINVDFDQQRLMTLKDRLLQSVHVQNVTLSDRDFVSGYSSSGEKNSDGEIFQVRYLRIEPDYVRTIGLELVDGRDFSRDEPTELNYNVIVNEAFVNKFGLEDPVGARVELQGIGAEITIMGVVRDFHFDNMGREIEPVVLLVFDFNGFHALFVRIDQDHNTALARVEKAWNEIVPEYTFGYRFMEDNLRGQYRYEDRWNRIIAYATVIAIFLSCLGLLGISGLMVARRFKEVGIRKANGATVFQVVLRLNRDILTWALVSGVAACPVAYFIMNRWIRNYDYRTEISWWIFALVILLTLMISMLTISLQTYRAARQDPVRTLRYE